MKLLINPVKILLFTMLILAGANYSYVQGGILWEKEYGCGESRACSPGAATFDETEDKLFIIGTSFKPVEGSSGKLWLWKIDPADGSRLADTVIMDIPEDCNALTDWGIVMIRALQVSPDGNLLTIGEFESGGSHIMKLTKDGQIIFKKLIEQSDEDISTYNIIALADNSTLVLGDDGTNEDDGMVIKLDSQGNRAWKKTYDDNGKTEMIFDGVPISTGGDFLGVGVSTNRDDLWNVWMLKCDSQGNKVAGQHFPSIHAGWNEPRVCRLEAGNFVVAYDKGGQSGVDKHTDYKVKCFNQSLEPLWEKQFTEPPDPNGVAGPFRISAVPGGGCIVGTCGAGSMDELKISEYDENGNELNGLSTETIEYYSNLSLTATQGKGFAVFSKATEAEWNMPKVKIIAFTLNQ